MIPFHPLTLADRDLVQQRVLHSDYRYCDYNFLNLIGWRFMYDTEVADYKGWLLFRFKADGHLAYQIPVGNGDRKDIIKDMLDDAQQQGHPFLMLGVFEHALAQLEMAMPGYFFAKADRNYSEYIYSRDKLSRSCNPSAILLTALWRSTPTISLCRSRPTCLTVVWNLTINGPQKRPKKRRTTNLPTKPSDKRW